MNIDSDLPTIHIISDSMGITARTVAAAAASQFGCTTPNIELLSNVRSFDEVRDFLNKHRVLHRRLYGSSSMVLFYTIVEDDVLAQLKRYLEDHPEIEAVDLMSDAVGAIAKVSKEHPNFRPGEVHATDENYFRRIAALEFTIAHDDGLRPQDLPEADIVIIGVSRTSKTPTSIYLGQEGYRVANIPLVLGVNPPRELFAIDRTRIFGLMTTEDVLCDIRRNRMGRAGAAHYADREAIRRELKSARDLMKRLDCKVINTKNRAIEETAQKIIRQYSLTHHTTDFRPY